MVVSSPASSLQKMSLFLGGLPWTAFSKFQSPNPTATFSIILFWFFFYSFMAYKYYWLSSAQTLEWIPWSEKILTVFFSAVSTLLLLSRLSCVWLCATPETAAHQAPPSLGFSRQEHWSGLPFPSPMHEGEEWKWSRSVVSDSSRPHGLQPTRLLRPWDFPGKSTGVGCHCLLQCVKVKSESEVTQSSLTLSDPMDGSPPGSSIHGIFQARVLE